MRKNAESDLVLIFISSSVVGVLGVIGDLVLDYIFGVFGFH